MRRQRWSDVELSAYLDGQLNEKTRGALATALQQDAALRRRLAELQQPRQLMRVAPLRETPRNYLLTPAMVAESSGRASQRRAPARLVLLRAMATVAAAAFALLLGAQLYLGHAPLMTMQDAAPAALWTEELADEPAAVEALTFSQEMERELVEVAPEAAPPSEDASPMEMPAEAPLAVCLPEEDCDPIITEDNGLLDTPLRSGGTEVPSVGIAGEEPIALADTNGAIAPEPVLSFWTPPLWLTVALGLLTALLGWATWRSRRH